MNSVSNFLDRCLRVTENDTVAIVYDASAKSWYERSLFDLLSIEVSLRSHKVKEILHHELSKRTIERVFSEVRSASVVIFLSQIGDALRFKNGFLGKRVVVYARNTSLFNSSFCNYDTEQIFQSERDLEQIFCSSTTLNIKCDSGTNLELGPSFLETDLSHDQLLKNKKFPAGIFQPIMSPKMQGVIALLELPSSNIINDPLKSVRPLTEPLLISVENSKIINITGVKLGVLALTNILKRSSASLGSAAYQIISWHAGLNENCPTTREQFKNYDEWVDTVFLSPKYLHFHVSGSFSPGEKCWMIKNPTIISDNNIIYDRGNLMASACII